MQWLQLGQLQTKSKIDVVIMILRKYRVTYYIIYNVLYKSVNILIIYCFL